MKRNSSAITSFYNKYVQLHENNTKIPKNVRKYGSTKAVRLG